MIAALSHSFKCLFTVMAFHVPTPELGAKRDPEMNKTRPVKGSPSYEDKLTQM